MRKTPGFKACFLVLGLILFGITPATANSWRLEHTKRRIVAHPDPVWEAGDAGLIVSCAEGQPRFAIQVRDPVPPHPKVRLQFGGHRGRKIHFLGEDGVIREFSGFSRGSNRRLAVASAAESRDIVLNLLPNASRVAWFVDLGDGFDSLELSTADFSEAWQKLGCKAAHE